jgi:hypothetical protein
MYSLSTSFWIVPLSFSPARPAPRDELVEQQQHGGRRVDRHRRRDLVERDAVEEQPHVVDRVDRDADLADLAVRDRVVAVVPHLGRQIEGDRESRRTGCRQRVVALVGLAGRTETGVLPHRPRPAGVHRRVDAARVGEVARLAELLRRVPPGEVVRAVDRLDRAARL